MYSLQSKAYFIIFIRLFPKFYVLPNAMQLPAQKIKLQGHLSDIIPCLYLPRVSKMKFTNLIYLPKE